MVTRQDLLDWVPEALRKLGGKARVADVARQIWADHRKELEESGDLFFTWQYDMRWAAQKLRKKGVLAPQSETKGRAWVLKK